ncbi:MAG: carbohydrate binding family 9 domain-containing protein, partial [Kangiellaceae bacterium]|nr:carbohydrate binding family 9 domain-containing protein [Kangiellaceae bacterium]
EDPNPEEILAFLRDRDRIFQDDFVGVVVDTFNDERKGFEFFVNALGAQGDLTVDDTRNREDSSWDAVWESLGRVTDDGYVVEMAIPYRALRFPAGLEKQVWGIRFLRIHPRESRAVYADSPTDRAQNCTLCIANKVSGMPNLESGNNLDITPTLTHVDAKHRDLDESTDWDDISDTEVGVDIRWAMTENWILNATLNPDFSQVEADAGQLDINTTFSLFFPEARPFFLDGAEYFNSSNRLVHTRNIADPDFGVKITGKVDGSSAGMIVARDTSTSFLLPGSEGSDLAELEGVESDIFIARYQKDVDAKSNVGALVTRRSADGYDNTVTAFDGKYFFTESDSLEVQLMHSDSTNSEYLQEEYDLAAEQSDHALSIRYRHQKENYSLRAAYDDFGEDFRADMGFVGRVNFKRVVLGGNYTWYGDKDSAWTRWGFFGDWDRTEDQDGKLLEEESELHFNLRGPKQFITNFGFVTRDRLYDEQLFKEDNFMMFFEFKPLSNLTVGNFMIIGDQIDYANTQLGERKLFEPFINWQLGKHLNIRVSGTQQALDVPGGELFNANLIDARISYQFNIRSRLSLTLQTTDIERNQALYTEDEVDARSEYFSKQLIYSYKINPLSLVYLGYSDNEVDNDNLSSLTKTDKAVFVKFSYMWQY